MTNSDTTKDAKLATTTLPTNASEQRLVLSGENPEPKEPKVTRIQIISVAILCYVNLINYMDRMTVAGVLLQIQETFGLSQGQSGLLQTVFILVYMIAAPTFGYLGDRYNRRYLMAFGVFLWSLTTLIGSFMPTYGTFLLLRCLVGVGEASYSTIAPTLIADMFVKDMRSKMLAVFYFAIPVGSGLGYMIGAETATIATNMGAEEGWRWGLRVTPVMGLIAVILIMWVMQQPSRGEVEGGAHLAATSFASDLRYLAGNRSFVASTLAFTCVTYVAGALSWWGPSFVEQGIAVQESPNVNVNAVAFVFGAIAMAAGLVGVPLGSFSGQWVRRRWGFGDPLVCGAGLLLSCPCLAAAMWLAGVDAKAAYAVVFFGQVFLNLNWSIISDMVLYIVIPTRRSSAEAFQILFSHALGDAGSPYIVGVVADQLYPHYLGTLNTTGMDPDEAQSADDQYARFKALQVSMYCVSAVLVLGAALFGVCCAFISRDKREADAIIQASEARAAADMAARGRPAVGLDVTRLPAVTDAAGGLEMRPRSHSLAAPRVPTIPEEDQSERSSQADLPDQPSLADLPDHLALADPGNQAVQS